MRYEKLAFESIIEYTRCAIAEEVLSEIHAYYEHT